MDQKDIERLKENRSYVIRQARMSDHQRAAYERLSPAFCIPERPIEWAALFSRPARIVVDIGFGMGWELAEIAERMPETNFLGIEVHKPGVGRLLGQIDERGLENVRIAQQDAVDVCGRLIPPESVDAVHLFFPDPWPKKRHHKRRLVRPGFPQLVHRILKPGGYLYCVTDWVDYAEQMLEVLGASSFLGNRFSDWAPPQEWRPTTAFERKGLDKGHQIRELMFERLQ